MCPECDNKTQVKSTKTTEEIILRKRQCVKCGTTIATLELIVYSSALKSGATMAIDGILRTIENHGMRSVYRDLAKGILSRINYK